MDWKLMYNHAGVKCRNASSLEILISACVFYERLPRDMQGENAIDDPVNKFSVRMGGRA